jgi:hypothetical protein
MKLYFLLLLFLPLSLFAQDEKKALKFERAGFGCRGGVVFSYLSPSNGISTRTSYQAGLVSQRKFSDKSFLVTELLFSNQGAGTKSNELVLYNVLVPLLYQRRFSETFFVEGGLQLSLSLNGILPNKFPLDNSTWFNGVLGGGVNLTDRNSISLRFTKGLSPIFKAPNFSLSALSISLVNMF